MSMENVKEFLALVKTDEGLARKVVELKDSLQDGANLGSEVEILAEKVLPLAKAHGLEFTVEEFLEYSNSMSGELSDDDLLNVSGGISARGVALGLLFATGLSFVPSILSSFAEGPGGSAPAAPETSYSQSYSSELEENSAMELKEREAEKEVRSSRDDVRRAGNQVRTAQKRVDTLKSKLQKEASIDDINGLSKKQKKKFSKLINQIAMAEDDLAAAQQKLDVARGQTETAEGAKSEVKKKNVKIRTERKEREETEKNEKQFREVMTELLETKKEQQEDMALGLADNKLEEEHKERQDEIKVQVEDKEKELEKKDKVVEENKDDIIENEEKEQTEKIVEEKKKEEKKEKEAVEKEEPEDEIAEKDLEERKVKEKEEEEVDDDEKQKGKDYIKDLFETDVNNKEEKKEEIVEEKQQKEEIMEADGTKTQELNEVIDNDEEEEDANENAKEDVIENVEEEEDGAEEKSDEQMKAELVKLLKDNSLVYSSKGEIKGFPANIVTAMLYARYPNYSNLEVKKQLQAQNELKENLSETKKMLTATIKEVHSEADSTQVDGLVSQCMTIISSGIIGGTLPNKGALVKQIQVKAKIDELSDTYDGTMSEESKEKLEQLNKEASGATEEKLAEIEETLKETEENLKKEYDAKLGDLKNRTYQINENLYDFFYGENYDTLDAKYQAIDREWKQKKPDLKQIKEMLDELKQLTQQKNVVDEVANAGNNKKFLQLEEEAKQQKTEKEILQERLNNRNIDLFGLSDKRKEIEEKLENPDADLGQIKTEIEKLESLANARKECLDRLENIKGEIAGLAMTYYYGFNAEAFEKRSVSIEEKLKEPNADLGQIKSEIENLESLVKAKETLFDINDKIKELKKQGKDTLALERKYDNVSDMLNKGDARGDEVQRAVTALEGSLSNVDNLTKVKFKGKGWFHDGTVENVYNSLKDADFDIDRIENQKQDQDQTWEAAFNFVLKTMNISKDGKTLEAKAERSACGTGKTDYKHKAMLKTLALFAMEDYKQDGAARKVTDPSTAKADDVKIDDNLKEFVGGKK